MFGRQKFFSFFLKKIDKREHSVQKLLTFVLIKQYF